jgi:hypothetical protein
MAQKGKKTKIGGARKGAGRKPVDDPKMVVTLYVKTSIVNAWGGYDEMREEIYEFLDSKASKGK